MKDIASRSRTPAQYLLSGDFSNVNGETLTASESGLVAKVKQRCRPHGQGVEDAMRISARLAGTPLPESAVIETQWQPPGFHTDSEMSDAATKALNNGMPPEVVFERYYGATPDEAREWVRKGEEAAARASALGVKAIRDAAARGD